LRQLPGNASVHRRNWIDEISIEFSDVHIPTVSSLVFFGAFNVVRLM